MITIAGVLLVDLDVNDLTAGSPTWINKGSLSGVFTQQGNPKKGMSGGKPAVLFDGVKDAYVGPNSTATLEGNSDRSIEVWVLNAMVDPSEEAILSWSNRVPNATGTMLGFNYGRSTTWGAATHWNAPDLPWGPQMSDAPQEGAWHHLVYTYDGAAAIVYVDGAVKNKKAVALNTKKGFSINLAAQREDQALVHFGSLALAVIRIHSEALTANEVLGNYLTEHPRFQ